MLRLTKKEIKCVLSQFVEKVLWPSSRTFLILDNFVKCVIKLFVSLLCMQFCLQINSM